MKEKYAKFSNKFQRLLSKDEASDPEHGIVRHWLLTLAFAATSALALGGLGWHTFNVFSAEEALEQGHRADRTLPLNSAKLSEVFELLSERKVTYQKVHEVGVDAPDPGAVEEPVAAEELLEEDIASTTEEVLEEE